MDEGDEGDEDAEQTDDQGDELVILFGEIEKGIHKYQCLDCKDNAFLMGLLYFCGKVTKDTLT